MEVAVIADIHGNFEALKAVLSDAFSEGVERIIVNGDLVNRGPNNTAVVKCLNQVGATIILGNHEVLIVKWIHRDPSLNKSFFQDPIWCATGWCARQLEATDSIDTLRGLPKASTIESEIGQTVLITHGSPRDYREGFGMDMSESKIMEIIEPHKAEVFIGSHTHKGMERNVARRKIINTGSVGAPFDYDTRAAYVIIRSLRGRWSIEFRRVAYDREAAMKAFETSGFLEEGGVGAQIFLAELEYARSFFAPFLKWCSKNGVGSTEANWEAFREGYQ